MGCIWELDEYKMGEYNEHLRGCISFKYIILKKNSFLEYNLLYQGLPTNETLMLI